MTKRGFDVSVPHRDRQQLTSSLTGTSVRLHRLRSTSFPLILSLRFNTLLFLLILGAADKPVESVFQKQILSSSHTPGERSDMTCSPDRTKLLQM